MGTGAIKAAALHSGFDLSTLVTWKAGEPVPFGFLAATFEAIAEESKVGWAGRGVAALGFSIAAGWLGMLGSACS